MPVSPHSAAEHVEAPQVQLDVTVNEAFDILDESTHALFTKSLTSADYTLTAGEYQQHGVFRISGTFTANRTLTIPDNNDDDTSPRPKKFAVVHSGGGGHTLEVTTVGGSGVTLQPSTTQMLYCDGTDVVPLTGPTGASGAAIEIILRKEGLPDVGEEIFEYLPAYTTVLPAGLTNTRARVGIAPSDGDQSFDLRKNGSSVGSIDVANGANTATFTFAAPVTVTNADRFTVVAPNPQDSTMADLSVTFAATRS